MAQANSVCAKPNKSVGQMQASMCDLWPRNSALFWTGMRQGGAEKGRRLAEATRHFI